VMRHISILFAGKEQNKIVAPGIVMFAAHAETGENGIVKCVINALMVFHYHVNIVIRMVV